MHFYLCRIKQLTFTVLSVQKCMDQSKESDPNARDKRHRVSERQRGRERDGRLSGTGDRVRRGLRGEVEKPSDTHQSIVS